MRSHWLWIGSLLISVGAGAGVTPEQDVTRIQKVVDDLKSRLSMSAQVTVTIVPENALLVSVEPAGRGTFSLTVEAGFADALDDDELGAVIAHELGHVWIFTHHPFLHTERLANDIAMRVVTRENLQRVYGKVWERAGAKGDLAQFLGQ